MDELKNESKCLQKVLRQFINECDEKDINIDDLKSYQDLEDTIGNIDIVISDFTEKLQKIIDQLQFI